MKSYFLGMNAALPRCPWDRKTKGDLARLKGLRSGLDSVLCCCLVGLQFS